jgi:hypothetical protein
VRLIAATDIRQAPLPGVIAAGGEPGGLLGLERSALAVPGVRAPVGGTDGVIPEPGVCRPRCHSGGAVGAPRVRDLTNALVPLSSRSGSSPDLLDVAGRPCGGRHVLLPSGPRPATIVRVPSGSPAVTLRPGSGDGVSRRTAIPLFARSC